MNCTTLQLRLCQIRTHRGPLMRLHDGNKALHRLHNMAPCDTERVA